MELMGKYIGSRYEILEKVGNGGMATVYKAKDKVLNRYVAIKVLKEEYTTDNEFIRRFNVEAQSAAGLTHPNIVSVYDVGNEDGIYYIVMELVQGKTLKQIIVEDGTLPWKWATNVAIQIASALEAAHKNNIVHRDIKPHNIIITEDGVAKVTDFGIAKAVSNSTITAFGSTIGSVHYFSPEHARGGHTDAKSDLYSLGVVMYEMLTGRVPFDADTPVSIALKHMQEKMVEPIKLNPSIPLAINQIIVKAMQKEPEVRYQSATEMLKDLNMALKNPEGKFIEDTVYHTQKVKTITKEDEEKAKKENEKESGLKKYFKKHPRQKILIISVIALLIFILAFVLTKTVIDNNTVRNVAIPELVGLTEEDVKAKLNGTKFTYEITGEEYSGDVEKGKVVSQDPTYRKNYTIKENSNIKIVISKGTEKTTVPKVVGMTYEEAVKELEKNKLKAAKEEEISEKVEEGYVIKQEVEEGTELNAGDSIKVFVSIGNGKEKIVVPGVVGKSENSAKTELENAKLKVEVVYEEDKSKSDGVVLKQSVAVSEVVDEGTTVTLTVNKIEQIKNGTVNINVKFNKSGNVNQINTKTHTIKILADGELVGKEYTVSSDTKITETVKGRGTIDIKVLVDGAQKEYDSLDLNGSNPVLNYNITVE